MDPLSDIDTAVPPSGPGCEECETGGGWWFHLRRCVTCGHIGCCDTSPMQHATRHYQQSGHPWIRSYEPGEDWFFSYVDQGLYAGPELAPPVHHPLDQPTPGPRGRVPPDWEQHLN